MHVAQGPTESGLCLVATGQFKKELGRIGFESCDFKRETVDMEHGKGKHKLMQIRVTWPLGS